MSEQKETELTCPYCKGTDLYIYGGIFGLSETEVYRRAECEKCDEQFEQVLMHSAWKSIDGEIISQHSSAPSQTEG